jgi:hypothetical protein
MLGRIAGLMVALPGGYDALYRVAPDRFPGQTLPHRDLFFAADTSEFGPELKNAFMPIVEDELIPQYVEKNRERLQGELAAHQPGGAVAGLVALYRQMGRDDYEWHPYGPDRDKIEWSYLTFDPPEKKLWEPGHRFRQVSLPAGTETWFAPAFDPKAAGWKTGYAPFANLDGKLAPIGDCKATGPNNFCGCGEPPNTFWDKEVLLMRAQIKVPPMREGYAYRLLVGGRSHYNAGGGTDVWLDGEYVPGGNRKSATIPAGSGRNSWRPWGVTIGNDFRKHFADGQVLVACNGFLRWGHKFDAIRCHKTFWFEEMKLPELPEVKKTDE